ncbi:hypothetical protein MLD38_019230 [Melastoma candidum]|nr:hypothetical protein MLD38_019230 [Melastoma candidum]
MDDSDGGLSFDFEGGLEPAIPSASAAPAAAAAASAAPTVEPAPSGHPSAAHSSFVAASETSGFRGGGGGGGGGGRSFRQTVCRHWLRSLCMKGDACGFLHQFDKARMPICRFFRIYGECREQDCVYKHTNEDIKECNM